MAPESSRSHARSRNRRRKRRSTTAAPSFRADIQGLRAIAVVAVILDHAAHWPSGGFVGVDVFFVISGFLITGLLLREHERTGRFSFRGFYVRRARRILPAALLVLLVTLIAAAIAFTGPRLTALIGDIGAAATFWANWHFAFTGTDYFNAGGPVSPIQHFWSLAVEEQFYVIWPLVLLLTLTVVKRLNVQRPAVRAALTAAPLAILTVASYAWATYESVSNPTFAYFSTFSRAWELGIGALLAVAGPALLAQHRLVRLITGWGGLALIVVSLFVVSGSTVFPAPGALLPVLGSALVISSGMGGNQGFLKPLTNPVAGYLGKISYSLYLWHFPVIVLLAVFFPTGSAAYVVALAAIILCVSAASYHLVEEPIRLYKPRTARQSAKRRSQKAQRVSRAVPVLAVVSLLAVAVLALNIVRNDALSASAAAQAVPDQSAVAKATEGQSTAQQARTTALLTALTSATWPTLSPSVDSLAGENGYVKEWTRDGCLDVTASNVDNCVYGDPSGSRTVVLVGDSHAISYLPALRAALPTGWRIQSLTLEQCPMAGVRVTKVGASDNTTAIGAPYPECTSHRTWALNWISTHRPDLVVWTDAAHLSRISATGDTAKLAALKSGVEATAKSLSRIAKQVVIVPGPPDLGNLTTCKTSFSTPSTCAQGLSAEYSSVITAETAAIENVNLANVRIASTTDWYCVAAKCPSFVNSTPMTADGNHLTTKSSRALGVLMKQVLLPTS